MSVSVKEVFEKSLSKLWADYEPRKSQVKMALEVESALKDSTHTIIEAGTGVGKSLAYLIPSALFAIENQELVVISTETKSLQDQIAKKDIDILLKLGIPCKAEVALGASNYLCKRKLSKVLDKGDFGPEMSNELENFLAWERETSSGIRTDYSGFISNSFWSSVSRDPDNCLAKSCPNFSISYYFLEKEKWKSAQILIVNHALLAAHMAGDFRILPPFKHLIVDEAHALPDSIGKAFGEEFNYEAISGLLAFLYIQDKKSGLIAKLKREEEKSLIGLVLDAQKKMNDFFVKSLSEIPMTFQFAFRHKNPVRLDEGLFEDSLVDLANEIQSVSENYRKESEDSDEKEIAIGLDLCISKLQKTALFVQGFREKNNSNLVYWIEPASQNSKDRFYKFYNQPKNVEDILKDKLFPNLESVVLTSATLATENNNFQFFKKEIGNTSIKALSLPSPFPYEKNALLFVPKNIADPVSQPDRNKIDVSYYIQRLLQISQGRAFVLFTANRTLQDIFEELKPKLNFPLFSQVELGPIQAKKEFLNNPHAVLFGVSSFWQGIDIKGDQLKQVIIAKLPFQVPTEPVLQAKMEDFEKEGRNPFWEMQIPKTCLSLRQGFGRLIRSGEDTGIVSILDPRIHTKMYGKSILKSLPANLPLITNVEDLQTKYENLPKY